MDTFNNSNRLFQLKSIAPDDISQISQKIHDKLHQSTDIAEVGAIIRKIVTEKLGKVNITILFHETTKDFLIDKPIFRSLGYEEDITNLSKLDNGELYREVAKNRISDSRVLSKVLLEGENYYFNDIDEVDTSKSEYIVFKKLMMRSGLFTPLVYENEIFGYILYWVFNNYGTLDLDENQKEFLKEVTNEVQASLRHIFLELYLNISQYRYNQLISNSSDLVLIMKENGIIIDANTRVTDILGYNSDEIAGMNITSLVITEEFDIKFEEKEFNYLKFKTKDQNVKDLEISMFEDREIGGTTLVYWMGRELSPRDPIMQRLIQTEKIKSLAVLSGGLAHDFNNYLSAIDGNSTLLGMLMENPSNEIIEALTNIHQIVEKSQRLTKRLLTFSTGGHLNFETIDLAEVIDDVVNFSLSGSDITRDVQSTVIQPTIIGDKGMLAQVFTNLLINAKEAMSSQFDKKLTIRIHADPANYYISIRDNGKGIQPENLDNIFDPFFSQKKNGTGLGLSITKSIINEHNGDIYVDSVEDKFTEFQVRFPVYKGLVIERKESIKHELNSTNIIWIMDDIFEIRQSLSMILQNHGQITEIFSEGREVLDALEKAVQFPDILIIDITNRTGMGGLQLVEELRFRQLSIPILLISGYAKNFNRNEMTKGVKIRFLPKPIAEDELIRSIVLLLD